MEEGFIEVKGGDGQTVVERHGGWGGDGGTVC
jgi:hypothetical protein